MRNVLLGLVALALVGCGSSSTETFTVSAAGTTRTVSPPAKTVTVTTPGTPTTAPASLPILIAGSFAAIKPSGIDFSGDAGNIVTGIAWSSWTATRAAGAGTSGIQSCVPNCAQGTTTQVPTTITLSDPQAGHFTRLVETRKGRSMIATFASKQSWPLGASG